MYQKRDHRHIYKFLPSRFSVLNFYTQFAAPPRPQGDVFVDFPQSEASWHSASSPLLFALCVGELSFTFEREILQDVQQQQSSQTLTVGRRLPQSHTLNTQ